MAQPDLVSFKRRGVAIALQSAEGTPATPSTSTNGVLLMNGSSGTEFDKVERPVDRPFYTNNPFVVANKRAFIEGDFELYPPAAPGNATATGNADCHVLLLPAGMAQVKNAGAKTTRYNPASSNISVATAYWWHNDIHKQVVDARNNITGLRMEIGGRFTGRVRIQGAYSSVTEDSLPTITVPSTVPPVITSANAETRITSIDSGPTVSNLLVWAKSLSIDFGNALGSKEYTSKKINAISDRLATWTLRIAKTDLSDFNPWALRDAGTLITAKITQTQANLFTSELGIRGQIDTIQEVDIDGDHGFELSGPCIASDSGGDEFYVLFTDTNP